MEELERVARSVFGLEVRTRLPISESFSSAVLSFIATDDRHYVLKRPWASDKAVREADALRALAHHPDVPALLATGERSGATHLLIEGLDGTTWSEVSRATPALLHQLGRSMRLMHATGTRSFGGEASWHDLLIRNADRYVAAIGERDNSMAQGTMCHLSPERECSSCGTSPNLRC